MNENEKLFQEKVLPIMDSVKRELNHKQLEEIGRHASSLSFIIAGTAGPDCGITAQAASIDSLRYTGKWNSKHTEDYIQMVKDELQKQNITVTPEIEQMMINKMIQDEIPKSSIDYILSKAATNTIFYLPHALHKSPLENHISAQAEKKYNPSLIEKGTGYVLGAAADYLTMGGIGGTWTNAAKFVGVDLAINAALDQMDESDTEQVPLVIDPNYREQYLAEQASRETEHTETEIMEEPPQVATVQEEPEHPVVQNEIPTDSPTHVVATPPSPEIPSPQTPQQVQTNENGWGGLLGSFGLNGISDIGHNLGYVLAMLPDMLVGIFTGKTNSLGLKDNLMPIASIVAGMFVRNPILKMVLIGMGGLNLLNKAGHEAMGVQIAQTQTQGAQGNVRANYKIYQDEPLDSRISQPQIRGNCLLATIDKVPCTIALSDKIVDAYNQGALPLNTLANAVLAKNDQMRQIASENYAANEQQTQTRTLAQR